MRIVVSGVDDSPKEWVDVEMKDGEAVLIGIFSPPFPDKGTTLELTPDQCVEVATALIQEAWEVVKAKAPTIFAIAEALGLGVGEVAEAGRRLGEGR
jgi:hypothetical protein